MRRGKKKPLTQRVPLPPFVFYPAGCLPSCTTFTLNPPTPCYLVNWAALQQDVQARAQVARATERYRKPFNSSRMAVNSISPARLHVRPTWALGTRKRADEIKKNTHPGNITALLLLGVLHNMAIKRLATTLQHYRRQVVH